MMCVCVCAQSIKSAIEFVCAHVKDIEWLAYWNVIDGTCAVCLCGMDTYLQRSTVGVWWGKREAQLTIEV